MIERFTCCFFYPCHAAVKGKGKLCRREKNLLAILSIALTGLGNPEIYVCRPPLLFSQDLKSVGALHSH